MILDEIQLEGFLSYKKNQTVNFKDVVTILVAGKNGSGKSSLFEALAVCWYGKKASRGKTLDELINEDCTTAYIRTDITFDNIQYRRIRQWGKKKYNSLSKFQNNEYIEIAKDNDADNKGNEILGSWDLFCTIYLKQKGIINFIEGDSSTRKALLRELLALDVYQDACEKSLKNLNEVTQKLCIKQNEMDSYKKTLLDEDQYIISLEQYQDQLKELKETQQKLKKSIVETQNQIQSEQIKEIQAEDVKKNILKIKNQKVDLEKELEKLEEKTTVSDIIKQNRLVKQIESNIDDNEEEVVSVEKKLQIIKKYQDMELHEFDKSVLTELSKKVSKLNLNIGVTSTSIKESKRSISKIDLDEFLQRDVLIKKELSSLQHYENKELHVIDKKIVDDYLDEVSTLSMHIGTNSSLVNEIEKKILKFENCEGLCPILEEPCKLVSNQEYLDSLTVDLNKKKKSLKLFKESLVNIENTIIKTRKDFKQKELENIEIIDSQKKLQSYKEQLIYNQKIIDASREELKKLTESLEQLTLQLEAEQNSLKTTEGKIEKIDRDIEQKELENKKILEAKNNFQLYNQNLDNLKMRLKEYKEQVKSHKEQKIKYELLYENEEKEKKKLSKGIVDIDIELQELMLKRFNPETLNTLQETFEKLNDDYDKNQKDQSILLELLGDVKARIHNFDVVKKNIKSSKEEIEKIQYDEKVYEKLVFAFGKNGIQKSIMKSAVPELERLATQLIQEFSINKDIMIRFDLDPQKKDGELKTQGGLDIVIIENGKSKNLSLYSGGETTQITFAIYLSLAELSSRRAGRQMQTLIIDERISGLDDDGISKFAEIIDVIKQRYNRCIIITHITQLKELFDSQLLIENTIDGSVIKRLSY